VELMEGTLKTGRILRNPFHCPASSEGSPPLPCSWEENTPLLPQGSVGQGEETVRSLIRWEDGSDKGFLKQTHRADGELCGLAFDGKWYGGGKG